MAIDRIYKKIIDDPKAPPRLIGKEITVTVELEKEIVFAVDMPPNPSGQELGYIRCFVGDMVDKLNDVPGITVDNQREELIP